MASGRARSAAPLETLHLIAPADGNGGSSGGGRAKRRRRSGASTAAAWSRFGLGGDAEAGGAGAAGKGGGGSGGGSGSGGGGIGGAGGSGGGDGDAGVSRPGGGEWLPPRRLDGPAFRRLSSLRGLRRPAGALAAVGGGGDVPCGGEGRLGPPRTSLVAGRGGGRGAEATATATAAAETLPVDAAAAATAPTTAVGSGTVADSVTAAAVDGEWMEDDLPAGTTVVDVTPMADGPPAPGATGPPQGSGADVDTRVPLSPAVGSSGAAIDAGGTSSPGQEYVYDYYVAMTDGDGGDSSGYEDDVRANDGAHPHSTGAALPGDAGGRGVGGGRPSRGLVWADSVRNVALLYGYAISSDDDDDADLFASDADAQSVDYPSTPEGGSADDDVRSNASGHDAGSDNESDGDGLGEGRGRWGRDGGCGGREVGGGWGLEGGGGCDDEELDASLYYSSERL
ncbi:hypothetical protein MMPV_005572 [Pyropia vietnamensis]